MYPCHDETAHRAQEREQWAGPALPQMRFADLEVGCHFFRRSFRLKTLPGVDDFTFFDFFPLSGFAGRSG